MSLQPTRALRLAGIAVALVLALALPGCALVPPEFGFSGVIQPSIVPAAGVKGFRTVEREFVFENDRIRLRVPIDAAVYEGSVTAPKTATVFGGVRNVNWVPDYYRALIAEKHQDAFYTSLIEALHEVREQKGLDSARYVELVTSMAQGLTYRTDPGNLSPKFPIQTFGDGSGDCDDKTLLVAGILSREGYDVAVLLFPPEKHVALGIRAPGLDYKKTGYAYVELTEPSLVGVPTEKLAGGIPLASQPEVIRIGDGVRAYTAGSQIEYIQGKLRDVRAAEKRARDEIARGQAKRAAEQKSLEAARQALSGIPDQAALAAAIASYNAQVNEANARTARLNALIDRYNALLDAERYAAQHQTARPQVLQRLSSVEL